VDLGTSKQFSAKLGEICQGPWLAAVQVRVGLLVPGAGQPTGSGDDQGGGGGRAFTWPRFSETKSKKTISLQDDK